MRNPDRAAERSAEIVLSDLGLALVTVGVDRRESRRGVQRLIIDVIEDRAMKLVRPRARREVDQAAADLTELGGKVRALQRELFDRVDRRLRLVEEARIERAGRILSLEDHTERAGRAAV